jgi:starvation-inducible DNA-binding protein
VLADSTRSCRSHTAHWNVEGPGFFAAHRVSDAVRRLFSPWTRSPNGSALDAYALGGLGTLARTAGLAELAAPLAQEAYVSALISANQKVVADAVVARDLAGAAGDAESQDLMIERVTLHQKTIWMLKSFLKS